MVIFTWQIAILWNFENTREINPRGPMRLPVRIVFFSYSFARQYNVITGDEVKRRKMWIEENESWLSIVDNDVDDLPGFEKKLEEQKVI